MQDKYHKWEMLDRSSEAETTSQVLRYFYRSRDLVPITDGKRVCNSFRSVHAKYEVIEHSDSSQMHTEQRMDNRRAKVSLLF